MTKHFLASEIGNGDPALSFFHVIPAPLEHSVSYGKGTAAAPGAIIEASDQLELSDGISAPAELGIHTKKPLAAKTPELFLAKLQASVGETLEMGRLPLVLGGEHTVSLGAAKAVYETWANSVGIIQIDAHADLRDTYEGKTLSHACVMRRILEHTAWPCIQIGIRAYCKEEAEYQQQKGIEVIGGRKANELDIRTLNFPADFPDKVYLTIDIDGLDPSIIPATGTPVPGGLGWYQTLALIESIASQRRIIAFDVVELAPSRHFRYCDFTAAQLVYNTMGCIARNS